MAVAALEDPYVDAAREKVVKAGFVNNQQRFGNHWLGYKEPTQCCVACTWCLESGHGEGVDWMDAAVRAAEAVEHDPECDHSPLPDPCIPVPKPGESVVLANRRHHKVLNGFTMLGGKGVYVVLVGGNPKAPARMKQVRDRQEAAYVADGEPYTVLDPTDVFGGTRYLDCVDGVYRPSDQDPTTLGFWATGTINVLD